MARPQLAKTDTAFQGASVGQPTEPCLGPGIQLFGTVLLHDVGLIVVNGPFGRRWVFWRAANPSSPVQCRAGAKKQIIGLHQQDQRVDSLAGTGLAFLLTVKRIACL